MGTETGTSFEALVGLIVVVSIASERLVEFIKGMIPWLRTSNSDAICESWRKMALQFLAVVAGIVTAFLAEPVFEPTLEGAVDWYLFALCIGLLASGGSGFWNAILSYLLQTKDLKKLGVRSARSNVERHLNRGYPEPAFGPEQMTSNECYNTGEK